MAARGSCTPYHSRVSYPQPGFNARALCVARRGCYTEQNGAGGAASTVKRNPRSAILSLANYRYIPVLLVGGLPTQSCTEPPKFTSGLKGFDLKLLVEFWASGTPGGCFADPFVN